MRATSPFGASILRGAALLLVATALGCARRGPPVARLLSSEGTVESKAQELWVIASPGNSLWVGDWLRTGPGSSARLSLGGGQLRIGENARLRILRRETTATPAPELAFELGSAEIEETSEEVLISTSTGTARLDRGARVRVRATEDAIAFEVLVGRAVVLGVNGQEDLQAGQAIRMKIRIGNASVERYDVVVREAIVEAKRPEPPPAPVVEAQPTTPPAAPLAVTPGAPEAAGTKARGPANSDRRQDRTSDGDPGNELVDVTLRAGETAVLHDARATLAVRLRFDTLCPAGARIQLGQGKLARSFSGTDAVVLRLGAGSQRYRLRCEGDAPTQAVRATGALTVRRDTGNVPLSLHPPANTVESDGRRYTVLFQSRLPTLTLLWAAAPAGARDLKLFVEGSGETRTFATPVPTHTLPSGAMGEGTFTWWYTTAGGESSPRTTVTIRFDNTAGTAQFFRVAQDDATASPETVAIDGVTLPGAAVSVGGQPIPTNGAGRFHTALEPSKGDAAVAVRLEHPRTGVHYYLRRRESP